jgi:molybdenum cofactor guanylyltransferase
MGRDKARLPFRGTFLVEAVAREVERAAGGAVVVGGHETVPGFPTIPDRYPGEGPLGGILTALYDTDADWNLVVACDMPEIAADFLVRVFEEAGQSGAKALIPTGPSGIPEPLCAVYHRTCREALDRAFAKGIRRIMEGLAEVVTARLVVPEALYFQNVNTPDDWAGYATE